MTTVSLGSLMALLEHNKRNQPQTQRQCQQQSVSTSGFDSHQFRSALAMLAASSLPSPTEASSSASLSPSSSVTDGGQSFGGPMTMRQRRPLDRSASDPVPYSTSNSTFLEQQGIGGGLGSGSAAFCRYKTELCRPFEENGSCKYADKCQFAHGRAELRPLVRHPKYKTDLCRTYHTTGLCPYGPRCHFIHNDEERRLYEMNRLMIEQKQQQQLQQASMMRTATTQQQQDVLAAALLAQRRLATVQSSAPQQQQVDHVMASSLQRSLSLGSQRIAFGNHDIVDSSVRVGSIGPPSGNRSAMKLSGSSRGSVDSVSSIDSSLSPTSSNKIISSPSSSSDVEYSSSSSNQRISFSGDQRHHDELCQPRNTSPLALSPEHFSYPAVYDNIAGLTPQLRQSSPHQQPLPSSDAAIMLALLTRRVRDAELLRAQQSLREDEVKAMLAKLLQSATGAASTSSTRYDVSSGESSGVGRCSGFGLATEQPPWALQHGTTATGCGDATRL